MSTKEEIIKIFERYSYTPADKKIIYENDFGQIADEVIKQVVNELFIGLGKKTF